MRLAFIAAVVALASGCGGEKTVVVTAERTVTAEPVTVTDTSEAYAPPVYVLIGPDLTGGMAYKPDWIPIGATRGIDQIEWDSYGGPIAEGRGVLSGERVSFSLQILVPCRGVAVYSVVVLEEGPNSAHAIDLDECPS